ncbi:MAG: class I SAM-dependent methyltransferase [Chloroflexi bacterium]|nr:class I SAM-dependent methyltransferase [Chloroflexota bacterium]
MSSLSYFNQVATQWDNLRQSFFSDAVRDKALDAAQVQSGALAADLGAGSGFITEGLVARGVRVIAVDQSDAMLHVMSAKFADEKFADRAAIEFRRGDADTLPIADGECDYVFANMYLHHTADPAHAIAEMARVLKPNGVVVITDADAHNFEFLREEQHDRWLGFARADIHKWFEQAGLRNIEVRDAEEKCCSTSNCETTRAEINIFLARAFKAQEKTAPSVE